LRSENSSRSPAHTRCCGHGFAHNERPSLLDARCAIAPLDRTVGEAGNYTLEFLMTAEENKAIFLRFIDELRRGNLDAIDEFCSPNFAFYSPNYPD
jgi:hypothetical protein